MRSLILILSLVIAQGCCFGQIKRTPTPMKTEIFSREISETASVKVYKSAENARTGFEIELQRKGQKSIRSLSVSNEEAITALGLKRAAKPMDELRVEDARIDPAAGDLLLIVDKFGFVDVLRYRLGADSLFNSPTPEVIPLRAYQLMPSDEQLQGESIEDVAIAQGKLIAMTASGYRHFGSHFISILNLETKRVAEFRAGTLDIRKASKEIRDESIQDLTALPFNDLELIKVLNSVKAKGGFSNDLLRLRFALLSKAFRASFVKRNKVNGNALFFVEIGGKPMVMLYTNLNEWYIAPEDVLKPESSNARKSREEVERLFRYQ